MLTVVVVVVVYVMDKLSSLANTELTKSEFVRTLSASVTSDQVVCDLRLAFYNEDDCLLLHFFLPAFPLPHELYRSQNQFHQSHMILSNYLTKPTLPVWHFIVRYIN